MKKKLIFTSITLGLVALLGFGFLGTIHSQPKEVKAQKKQLVLNDNGLYFHFVNLRTDNNVAGSSLSNYFTYNVPANNTLYRYRIEGKVTLFNQDYTATGVSYIDIGWKQSYSIFRIEYVGFKNGDYEKLIYDYSNDTFNDLYFGIQGSFTAETPYITEVYEGALLDRFTIKIGDNGNRTNFDFAKQINYNSPYQEDISSFAVNDSYFTNNPTKLITYDLPYFISGGFLFNQIKVWYQRAFGSYWFHSGGSVEKFNGDSFGYYEEMAFINTNDNFAKIVNKRNRQTHEINNGETQVILNSSSWVSNEFQKLYFLNEPSPESRLDLNQFNNNIFGDSFAPANNSDIGLGNVFNLLTMAFSSWIPIFAVQVIPGISIGLLIFLPLIAGIIIFIIWVVKR